MYFLKAPNGEKILIKPGILKVGRKQCDVLLQSTASSRFHAEILLNIKENYDIHNLEEESIDVNVKDHSKTGTFVNNTKISTNEQTKIKSGDEIIFGDPQYIYTLEYDPIIVTLSRITKTEKQKIEKTIKLLGGFICKNWDERCKYVIVNNDCELTLKVVWGCIYELPIITSEYFKQLLNSDKTQNIDINKYIPTMETNTNIPDLHPMKCRRKTFENKTLIFIRQSQYENMPLKCGGNEIQLYKMNKKEIKSFDWRKYSIGYLVIPCSNDLNDNENEYINIIQSINKNIYRMEESSIPTYIIYPNLPMPSQFTQTQSQINTVTDEDISYTIPDTQINKNDLEKQMSFTTMEFNEPKPLSKLNKKSINIINNKRKYEEIETETQIDNIEPDKKKMKKIKLHEMYGDDDSSSDIDDNNGVVIHNNNNNNTNTNTTTTRLSILQMDDDDSNNSILSITNNTPSKRVDPFSLPSNKRRKTNNIINDDFVQLRSTVNDIRKKAIKITNNDDNSKESELSLSSDKINEVNNNRKVIVNESDKKVAEDGNVNVIIMPMINISIKPPGKQFVKKLKNNSVSKTKLSAYVIND